MFLQMFFLMFYVTFNRGLEGLIAEVATRTRSLLVQLSLLLLLLLLRETCGDGDNVLKSTYIRYRLSPYQPTVLGFCSGCKVLRTV